MRIPKKFFELKSPFWLIVVCFLGIRSLLDPFGSLPFPRLFDIYGVIIAFAVILTGGQTRKKITMATFFVLILMILLILSNVNAPLGDLLLYFKIIQASVFAFLISSFIRYDEKIIISALRVVLAVNVAFLYFQVVTGNFYGVERAFEKRGATFIEPAIGASGFTMAVLCVYFFRIRRYVESIFGLSGLLIVGSGSAFVFTVLIIGYQLVFSVRKLSVARIGAILAIGVLVLISFFYFSDQRFVENIVRRSLTVYKILSDGAFYLLGNRWDNWTEHVWFFPPTLLGYGIGTAGVIDNMYLKISTDLGFVGLVLTMALFAIVYIYLRDIDLVQVTLILVVFMSLSHDILTPIRVLEIVTAVVSLGLSKQLLNSSIIKRSSCNE